MIRGDDLYSQARNIFCEKDFEWIPVVDDEGYLIDVFSRRRAFYKKYFEKGDLPYIYYARAVWAAANEARKLDIKRISVIEFGVAGGNGLIALEFHAREIGRILGIEIDVYGFDTGEGLPDFESDYREMSWRFRKSLYKMDEALLKEKLTNAKLIIGDIGKTGKEFFGTNPAPIGAVMVDVDIYTSSVSTLQVLETEYTNVLPRVFMYFDDIFRGYENTGQSLAITEFNIKNKGTISISPEGTVKDFDMRSVGYPTFDDNYDIKICHYFNHPLYNKFIEDVRDAPLASTIL